MFWLQEPYRWCNGKRARIECGIPWIRVPVGSNQGIYIGYLLILYQYQGVRANIIWLGFKNKMSELCDISTSGLFHLYVVRFRLRYQQVRQNKNSGMTTLYVNLSVICAAFLQSVPIDKARVDVLDHIRNLLGQFII